jgi:hypothetical protein
MKQKTRATDLALGCVLGMAGTISCAGITQSVELLRAQRIELIDDSSRVELEVGAELRKLKARIEQLERAAAR